jgi:hypothetical protein
VRINREGAEQRSSLGVQLQAMRRQMNERLGAE